MNITPTPEQAAIVEFAKARPESLLISALAGSAKTTTLDLIVKALPVQPILSLAFNKRIADEMVKRLPGHVQAKTLNSVGHGVWMRTVGRGLKIDSRKTFELLKGFKLKEKVDWSETIRAVSAAKAAGYVPKGAPGKGLLNGAEFFEGLDEPVDEDLVDKLLLASIVAAYEGNCDFDDQIYMPTLFGGTFPRFPLVCVDEAQDLSPLNHAMLERLAKDSRLIAVGDKRQSIYAFRGADTSSMERLKVTFAMEEMTLSTSFRCPRAVVRRARKHAPHMAWPEWAEEGEVLEWRDWGASMIPEEAAIICRNNAPLFRMAMALIQAGRGVKLVGTDLGPQLVKALKKLGPMEMGKQEVEDAIQRWESERLPKSRSKAAVEDKADCLRVFASYGETLGAAIAYAEHLFAASGPIQLLSGHKSKGLEWPTVIHLDPWRIPSKWAASPEEKEQERNLDYVITTRAKRRLIHANLEDFT